MSLVELPETIRERARAICAEFDLSHKGTSAAVTESLADVTLA